MKIDPNIINTSKFLIMIHDNQKGRRAESEAEINFFAVPTFQNDADALFK